MIPDDLELPAAADSAALESLVAKLADIGFEMTPEEAAAFKEAATKAYAAAAKALSDVKTFSKGNTMFDLYALMKLMIEVAQKQRDAQREQQGQRGPADQGAALLRIPHPRSLLPWRVEHQKGGSHAAASPERCVDTAAMVC